jgi:DNA-binding NarL/FixJ family response regulator
VIYCRSHLWLDALRRVLTTLPVELAGAAATDERCRRLLEQHQPDLLVIDADDATFDTDLRFLEETRASFSSTRVVLLTYRSDQRSIEAAVEAGITAYTFKTAPPRAIAAAISAALTHSTYIEKTPPPEHSQARDQSEAPEAFDRSKSDLTPRELEILSIVATGLSNSQIAKKLWVTEQTVKFHLSNIYRKLNVTNRTEASRWAHVRPRSGRLDPVLSPYPARPEQIARAVEPRPQMGGRGNRNE